VSWREPPPPLPAKATYVTRGSNATHDPALAAARGFFPARSLVFDYSRKLRA